jgi:SnoaL-like protein
MTLDDLLIREEIRYTMSVYNTEGDRGRVSELATAFCEDGVLDFNDGRQAVGRDAIIAALSPNVEAKRSEHGSGGAASSVKLFLRHNLTTCRIELGDGEAHSWTYFQVVTPAGLDHVGVYIDHFVPVGDRWLIKERRVKIDWSSPTSTMFPAGG